MACGALAPGVADSVDSEVEPKKLTSKAPGAAALDPHFENH